MNPFGIVGFCVPLGDRVSEPALFPAAAQVKTPDQDSHETPPPAANAGSSRWRLVKDLVLWAAILALVLALLAPFILKPRRADSPYRDTVLNNLRQIGLALSEFDVKYGRFPDAATIAAVKKSKCTRRPPRRLRPAPIAAVKKSRCTSLTLDGTSSNKLFRQLIANGLSSEKPFWAPGPNSPHKPDDVFGLDSKALMPGECGFAYVAGLSSKDDPGTPIVMTPLLKGQKIFDRGPHAGKAMVLFLDWSAVVLPIEKDGRVLINGMDIFDPHQPFWKGKTPDIKWQE